MNPLLLILIHLNTPKYLVCITLAISLTHTRRRLFFLLKCSVIKLESITSCPFQLSKPGIYFFTTLAASLTCIRTPLFSPRGVRKANTCTLSTWLPAPSSYTPTLNITPLHQTRFYYPTPCTLLLYGEKHTPAAMN